MKRAIFAFTVIFVLAGIIAILLNNQILQNKKNSEQIAPQVSQETNDTHPDAFNMMYVIEGNSVTLTDGVGSIRDDVVGTEKTYRLFKKPIFGDIGGDGDADAVVIITEESSGTGTFYYGAVIENQGGSFRSSNALYLGDRIVPEYITIQANDVFFTFLDRAQHEAMAEKPSHERILKATYNTDRNMLLEL